MKRYVCIDIGGTGIKYALFNELGERLSQTQEHPTPSGEKILETVQAICHKHIAEGFDGIAISSAGVIDPVAGTVVYAGPTIANYIGTDFKTPLEEIFKVSVSVENDVNAALLGEYWKGSAQGSQSTFMITVGTGIGGAFMIGDQLWHGSSLSGGEVGYMNVNGQHYQTLAASSIMVKEASKVLNRPVDGKEVFRLAQEGNMYCIDVIRDLVSHLCLGISDIMYLLNPETIILGGGIMAQRDYLEPLIHESLNRILIDQRFKSKRIEFAQCGNDAGMIGALFHLLQGKKV